SVADVTQGLERTTPHWRWRAEYGLALIGGFIAGQSGFCGTDVHVLARVATLDGGTTREDLHDDYHRPPERHRRESLRLGRRPVRSARPGRGRRVDAPLPAPRC